MDSEKTNEHCPKCGRRLATSGQWMLSSRRVDAAPLALVVAGTDAMFDALDAARAASTLAPDDPDRPHSVRLGYSSPTPLAALAKRARESGVAVTRDADKEPA